ncbi:MAG: hydrogenase maturation nickel metallochaperone HypA [Firmicutes bacterium]|nr:hydrogenase maturation nickel metallochaperone HypA [Bacillota bacterium]
MHEIGALTKAIDLIENVAIENGVEEIKSVTLEVGELTGFLPVFFEKYFPVVVENRPVFKNTELIIVTVKGQALCNECEALYNVMKNEGKCPNCGSREKSILGGQDFVVKHIGY